MSFNVNDIVALLAASIAAVATAPVFNGLLGFGGPLTNILSQLVVPGIMLALIISAGISARGDPR